MAFPGSHLLAMRYLPAGGDPSLLDEIHFYFTTTALAVKGKHLEKLYQSLLLGNPIEFDQTNEKAPPYRIALVLPRRYVETVAKK